MALLSSDYYMHKMRHDQHVLHYRRSPTWRSWLLLTVLLILNHFISLQAPFFYLRYLCYILGVYFSYLATEKYEDVIIDKRNNTIVMKNARFLQKMTIGYKRQIVTDISEVVGLMVQSVQPTAFGEAHQVIILYMNGLSLSLTSGAIYCNKRHQEEVATEIKKFLGLPTSTAEEDSNDSGSEETSDKKNV